MTQPLLFPVFSSSLRRPQAVTTLARARGGVGCRGGRGVGALKIAGGEDSLVSLAARRVEHGGAVGWRGKLRVPKVEHEDGTIGGGCIPDLHDQAQKGSKRVTQDGAEVLY
jgi:hypothetical protein